MQEQLEAVRITTELVVTNEENDFEFISTILSYLNAEELRNARLVNHAFNRIITSHPMLLWDKNVMRIHIQSGSEKGALKEWVILMQHRLIAEYKCPNFHFTHTNLRTSGAGNFFRSLVSQQIQYLKLSSCHATTATLLGILTLCSKSLEHLEISDFLQFEPSSEPAFPGVRSNIAPTFRNLSTLILDGYRSDNTQEANKVELSSAFLREILGRCVTLETVLIRGWNAKTCLNFVRTLSSLFPEFVESVQFLEINCIVDEDLEARKQYAFVKDMDRLYLPNLRHFLVWFDLSWEDLPEENQPDKPLLERFTKGMATLIEGAAETLEVVAVINCPVSSNGIFRRGVQSFPKLCRVNTTGTSTIQPEKDNNGNSIFDMEILPRQRRRGGKRNESHMASPSASDTSTTFLSENEAQQRLLDFETMSRVDLYICGCVLLLFVAVIHFALKYLFSTFHPYAVDSLETVIFATAALYLFKGSELRTLWSSKDTCIL